MSKHYNHLSTVLKNKAEWIWKRQKVVEKENGWNRFAIQSILFLYKHMNNYNDDSQKLNKNLPGSSAQSNELCSQRIHGKENKDTPCS